MKLSKDFPFVAILAILMLVGAAAAVRQLTVGLGATALHEPVVWGLYVVCFAYFAGIGAGALTVASATLCSGSDKYRGLARSASIVSLISLMLAGMFITIDLGRPERAVLLVLKGRFQSPLVWDFIILNAMLVLAALYTLVLLRWEVLEKTRGAGGRLARLLTIGHKPGKSGGESRIMRLLAGIMVVGVPVVYLLTVRVFATLRARPAWNTTALPSIFLVSALVSGLAATAVVTALFKQANSTGQVRRVLSNVIILLIGVDIVLSFSPFAGMRQFTSPSQDVIWAHIGSPAIVELIVGLLAPLMLLAATRNKRCPWLGVPSVLILLGAFVKRWHIIIPAMLQRNLPLPEASYYPNVVECGVSVGIIAFGILLVHLAMRLVLYLDGTR